MCECHGCHFAPWDDPKKSFMSFQRSRTNHQKLHVDWSWYVLKLLGCLLFLKWWFLVAMLGFSRWVWWNRHVMTTWPIFFWHQPTFYFFEHQWWMQHCARFWLLMSGNQWMQWHILFHGKLLSCIFESPAGSLFPSTVFGLDSTHSFAEWKWGDIEEVMTDYDII